MTKKKQKPKIQIRDWAIIVLAIAILGTNWLWYQYYNSQQISNNSFSTNFLSQQIEINKLQACINDGTRPCDITPVINDLNQSKVK